jgi:uncharacterized protein YcbK (DUF882 family)
MSRQGARLRGATERARKRAAKTAGKLEYLRKRLRHAKGLRARRKYVKAVRAQRAVAVRDNAAVRKYEAALAAFRKLARRPYPHLSGDLDADRAVLERLERLARKIGRNIYVTSGLRTQAQQKALYDNRASNPFPVAFCCPCSSKHCLGEAADCLVGGAPIQAVVSAATIASVGLYALPGDAVHVQLP